MNTNYTDKKLDEYYNTIDNIFKGVKDSLPLNDEDLTRGMKFMLFLLHEKIQEEYTKIKYKDEKF
jgi:hypothetical protein